MHSNRRRKSGRIVLLLLLIGTLSTSVAQEFGLYSCETGLGGSSEFQPACFVYASGVPIHDPEISPDFKYITWQSSPVPGPNNTVNTHGKLYIAPLDYLGDGDVILGQTQIIQGAFPAFYHIMVNGPEWGNSLRGQEVYITGFTKNLKTVRMKRVSFDEGTGNWVVSSLPSSYGKGFGIATWNSDWLAPKITFMQFTGSLTEDTFAQHYFGYREDNDNPLDNFIAFTGVIGRWIEGTGKWVYMRKTQAEEQLVIHDTENGTNELVDSKTRFPGSSIVRVGSWLAPELGDEPVIYSTWVYDDKTILKVYRENIEGTWVLWNTIESFLPNFPHIFNPEGFAFNGKSYCTMLFNPLVGTPNNLPQPSHIALISVDPGLPAEEQTNRIVSIDSPTAVTLKGDPEFILTQRGTDVRIIYRDSGFP